MEQANSLLAQEKWRIIDQSTLGIWQSPLHSFATDDALCESVGSGFSPAVARTWVHRNYVILGIQDIRLPKLAEGLAFLKEKGFDYIVRTSGGLAVPLDEGILNITLVFSEKKHTIDINRGYEAMYRLIQDMFSDVTDKIRAGEIHGSYCPGSYDLSINGKKFAGISQRRVKNGVAVQIYLGITGSGGDRAKIIQEFYHRSIQNEAAKFSYPNVEPRVMASLSELLDMDLTVQDCMLRLLQTLKDYSKGQLYNSELTEYERKLYPHYYGRVVERNEKWLPGFGSRA